MVKVVKVEKFDNVLVVAFDGLDYKKIEKYGCENLKQQEFGKVEITDYERFGTPWLWASFLTGQRHDFRYVKKLKNSKLENLETFLWKNSDLMTKWSGLRGKYLYRNLLDVGMTNHTKEDLESESFIDELGMDAYYVPAYNEYPFNEFAELASTTVEAIGDDLSKEEAFRRHRGFFLRQREELENKLRDKPSSSMMFYFKFTDSAQHLIFNDSETIDYMGREYGEEDLYREIDELAGKIRQLSDHELVLFVSDHGLSSGDHNENAFYSSNRELGLEEPHITDFHALIVEKVRKSSDEIEGIEI